MFARVERVDGEEPIIDSVGEIVDHTHRGVTKPELAGHHAFRRHGHPDHVGVAGEIPDLRRGLETGTERLPVDATVAQRNVSQPAPRAHDAITPLDVEAGDPMSSRVVERGDRRVERDEIGRGEKRADRQLATKPAHRADREHSVAAQRDQCPLVRDIVDAMRWRIPVETMPLQHDVIAAVDHSDLRLPSLRVRDGDVDTACAFVGQGCGRKAVTADDGQPAAHPLTRHVTERASDLGTTRTPPTLRPARPCAPGVRRPRARTRTARSRARGAAVRPAPRPRARGSPGCGDRARGADAGSPRGRRPPDIRAAPPAGRSRSSAAPVRSAPPRRIAECRWSRPQ